MARPSAELILTAANGDSELDILVSEGYWTIGYLGQPVSLRQRIWTQEGEKMKYPRTGFNNRAHCERLAVRLNKLFETDAFECITLIDNEMDWDQNP